MKGTDHSSDIAHGRALDPPFTNGPGRFSIKIDYDKIFPGVEDLTKVIIAVAANAHRIEARFINSSEPFQNFRLSSANLFGLGTFGLGQGIELFPEQLEIFNHKIAHRL